MLLSRGKRNYTDQQLESAVLNVIAEKMSGNQAALAFGVPQRTVARYVIKYRKHGGIIFKHQVTNNGMPVLANIDPVLEQRTDQSENAGMSANTEIKEDSSIS